MTTDFPYIFRNLLRTPYASFAFLNDAICTVHLRPLALCTCPRTLQLKRQLAAVAHTGPILLPAFSTLALDQTPAPYIAPPTFGALDNPLANSAPPTGVTNNLPSSSTSTHTTPPPPFGQPGSSQQDSLIRSEPRSSTTTATAMDTDLPAKRAKK